MSTVATAKELFDDQIPRALAAHPDKAREVDAIFCFKISGEEGGDWTVDLTGDPPICVPGDSGQAQCVIEVSADDFKTMLSDGEAGMQLYFEGRLKVGGDPMLATRLPTLFSAIRPGPNEVQSESESA